MNAYIKEIQWDPRRKDKSNYLNMRKYLPPPHKFRPKNLDSTDTVDFTHFRRTVNRYCVLSPFNRSINCTCRHNISREIYFCTNPTHRRLSKMVGRSVENEIEIRADIKTRALLSRGSTDIYADICTVYVSNSMSFLTVCRQVRDVSAGVGPVTSAPKYCRSKSASSPKIVIKKII